ncbi:ankyrin repeat-containing domain protein [Chaetomium sp. MPI-SDFR-AT-0129]|nr:ankyrin repeat-containing domain protein [Chaetomium sp. MPI-SDFR-AT-0129]
MAGALNKKPHIASLKGHQEMVELFLDKGADVNAQGGGYSIALQAASVGGHREIFKLLLNDGADINVQGGKYGNAPQAASSGGHREVVKLLNQRLRTPLLLRPPPLFPGGSQSN